jgi:predicted membrane chloride channel (bestrophin family)
MLVPPPRAAHLVPAIGRWTVAFARATKAHLREDGDASESLRGVLTPEEHALFSSAPHRPLACLAALSAAVREARLDPMSMSRLDDNLTAFEDILGACERILKTPIVSAYTAAALFV